MVKDIRFRLGTVVLNRCPATSGARRKADGSAETTQRHYPLMEDDKEPAPGVTYDVWYSLCYEKH